MTDDNDFYRKVRIQHDREDGFFGTLGLEQFGYCDTVEQLHAEIDDHYADEDARREIPLDTPSLDTSFHDHEMDC